MSRFEAYGVEDLFNGLPDILIVPTDSGVQSINTNVYIRDLLKPRFFAKSWGGGHGMNCAFTCYGSGIRRECCS